MPSVDYDVIKLNSYSYICSSNKRTEYLGRRNLPTKPILGRVKTNNKFLFNDIEKCRFVPSVEQQRKFKVIATFKTVI